jgi:hypothetical protein
MVPLSLVNIMVVAILAKVLQEAEASTGLQTIVLLAANLLMIAGVYVILGLLGRRARRQDEALAAGAMVEPEPAAAH